MKKLIIILMVFFMMLNLFGCGLRVSNDSIAAWGPNKDGVIKAADETGTPPSDAVFSLSAKAPQFVIEGHVDAVATANLVVDGVVNVAANAVETALLPGLGMFKPIIETIFGPPAPTNGT